MVWALVGCCRWFRNCGILAAVRLRCRPGYCREGLSMPREYVWLECSESGQRNYRTSKETRGTERLELKKYCPKLRKHTIHKESRKK